MTPPGTFDRVYAAIKQRLRDGLYRPGARLEPAILSDELNASVTPVRDALHRLTGERMVEAPRHEGFRVPMLTEAMLRQLYGWHLDLLLLAVMKQRFAPETQREPAADSGEAGDGEGDGGDEGRAQGPVLDRQNALFLWLATSTGNQEHAQALLALSQRLEPVQRLEAAFLDGTDAETRDILQAIRAGDRRALRKSLVDYHRRRERLVPELLAALLRERTDALPNIPQMPGE